MMTNLLRRIREDPNIDANVEGHKGDAKEETTSLKKETKEKPKVPIFSLSLLRSTHDRNPYFSSSLTLRSNVLLSPPLPIPHLSPPPLRRHHPPLPLRPNPHPRPPLSQQDQRHGSVSWFDCSIFEFSNLWSVMMEYGEFVIGFILLASGFLLMLLFVPPVVYAFDLFVAMFTKRPPNSLIGILVILVLHSHDSKVWDHPVIWLNIPMKLWILSLVDSVQETILGEPKVENCSGGKFTEAEIKLLTDSVLCGHPNMVKLNGYCFENGQFGVVYDLEPLDTVHKLVLQGDLIF
ncbi:hypothetical protein Vadar_002740 [Vaccinium darrowii]|uniref:Uncharacterized protein n=1 Tax=Vaccinium darrowii TaxID=229202 RepID=A0ACB7XWA1_9ERIC|nr:hypothetical protein Vadar_002740 [Vaccinium darrowii]